MFRRFLFLPFFIFYIFSISSLPGQDQITNERIVLENGMKLIFNSSTVLTGKIHLHLIIHSGSFNETEDERSAAHILNHLLFYDLRKNHPEIWKKMSLGRSTFGPDNNSKIHFHETVISFEIDQKDHDLLEGILVIISNWFKPDFEKYLDPDLILKDITALDHNLLNGYKVLQQLHYASTTNSTCLEGKDPFYSIADFKKISPSLIKQYYHKNFYASNTTLFLTGSFHAPIINMLIVGLFHELPINSVKKDTCQILTLNSQSSQIHTIADSLVSISTLQLNYSIAGDDFMMDAPSGFDEYASTVLNYWFRETILQNKGDSEAGIIVGNVFVNQEIKGIYTLTLQIFVQDKKFKEGIEFAAKAWLDLLKNGFTKNEWDFISEYILTLKQGREVLRNRSVDNKNYSRKTLENYLNNRDLDFNWIDLQEYDEFIQDPNGEKFHQYLIKFIEKAVKNLILAVPEKNKYSLPANSYINTAFELNK